MTGSWNTPANAAVNDSWGDPAPVARTSGDTWGDPAPVARTSGDTWGDPSPAAPNGDVPAAPQPVKKTESSFGVPRKGMKKIVTLADLTKDGLKEFPFEADESVHTYTDADPEAISPSDSDTLSDTEILARAGLASMGAGSKGQGGVGWDFPASTVQPPSPKKLSARELMAKARVAEIYGTTPPQASAAQAAFQSPETVIYTEKLNEVPSIPVEPILEYPKRGKTEVTSNVRMLQALTGTGAGNAMKGPTTGAITTKTVLKPDASEFIPKASLAANGDESMSVDVLCQLKVLLDNHSRKLSAREVPIDSMLNTIKLLVDDYFHRSGSDY